MHLRILQSLVVVCAAAAVIVTASSNVVAQKRDGKSPAAGKAPSASLVWPLPPEQPRIRYVRSYQGIDDFKTAKKKSKFAALLLGPRDQDAQSSDHLVKPYGVAVSPGGKVYVADTASRRVFGFDPDAQTVTFFGGEGAGKLAKPVGVAVDDQGVLFVADGTLKRVFGYGRDGRLQIAIGHDGDLQSPSGLAIDRVHHLLYVADASKHHVNCYSSTDGSLLRTIGTRGDDPGQFNFPTNLTVDRHGRLYVTDTFNFRIQIFDADGAFVKMFGTVGDAPGTFNRPKGIGVDSEGHIYVLDASFNNFQIFDDSGQLLLFVGTGGRNPGEFFLPAGMSVDDQNRIYVADQGNSRIQVFQFINGATK